MLQGVVVSRTGKLTQRGLRTMPFQASIKVMFDRLFQTSASSPTMSELRARMVEEQLQARGIHDERVLAAMAKVPREAFVEAALAEGSYGDHPVPIGAGQTISQPFMVASMVEALEVGPDHRVLEIGTGTGYEAAILGELAKEVWTVERIAELAARAREILAQLGCNNVHVEQGDGSHGLPEHAPYDRILVAAAAPHTPPSLVIQLAEGGRLVLPVGSRFEQQVHIIRKVDGTIVTTTRELCRFVPLLGEEGWQA